MKNIDLSMVLMDSIKRSMIEQVKVLHEELSEKYMKEFNERMRKYEREIVLNVCEKIEIEQQHDPITRNAYISIHL